MLLSHWSGYIWWNLFFQVTGLNFSKLFRNLTYRITSIHIYLILISLFHLSLFQICYSCLWSCCGFNSTEFIWLHFKLKKKKTVFSGIHCSVMLSQTFTETCQTEWDYNRSIWGLKNRKQRKSVGQICFVLNILIILNPEEGNVLENRWYLNQNTLLSKNTSKRHMYLSIFVWVKGG